MSDYMQAAAEKAIHDLQIQVDNADAAAATAKESAESVARSARWWKTLTVVLVLVVAGVGYLAWTQHTATNQLRQQAINGCMTGNARAAADNAHWDLFIAIAMKGNTDPAAPAKAKQLSDAIAKSDAPRNCSHAYGK